MAGKVVKQALPRPSRLLANLAAQALPGFSEARPRGPGAACARGWQAAWTTLPTKPMQIHRASGASITSKNDKQTPLFGLSLVSVCSCCLLTVWSDAAAQQPPNSHQTRQDQTRTKHVPNDHQTRYQTTTKRDTKRPPNGHQTGPPAGGFAHAHRVDKFKRAAPCAALPPLARYTCMARTRYTWHTQIPT